MFGFLGKKSALDPDFFEWAVTISKWTIENFDGLDQLRNTPLVLPTAEYFDIAGAQGRELAAQIFSQLKALSDMSEWECELVEQAPRLPHELGDSVMQKFEQSNALGTFSESIENEKIVSRITYDPELVKQPAALITTLAHELAHLLMHSEKSELPFAAEMEEPATDSLAIMMGFEVFIANGSSGFRADDHGWEYHRSGYLCEGEILHVLAAFLFLSGNDIADAKPHLKRHLYRRLSNVYKEMSSQVELLRLLN